MRKDNHFFGTAVFGQLISYIRDGIIEQSVNSCKSDYYTKHFTTKDHLVSMLFCTFAKCNSLREVSGALLGLGEKTKRFGLQSLPHKSTLADANKRRNYAVFGQIYHKLLRKYQNVFSDSRFKEAINKHVEIFDSTTITLFQEILKCAGRKPSNGKRKGGIKVHTVINAYETVPKVVWFSSAATNDHVLPDKLEMSMGIL